MNNQNTTLEQAAEQHIKKLYNADCYEKERQTLKNRSFADFIAGANWQKEQDEAKYKALLESHNELLKTLGKAITWIEDDFNKGLFLELINKAKNI